MHNRNTGKKKNVIIVLSGLDGSGKSTQAKLLAEKLSKLGIESVTIWNRWEPRISAPLIKLAKKYLTTKEKVIEKDYSSFTMAKQKRMKSGWKRALWQLMVWCEYLFEVYGRIIIPMIKGKTIVFDRYFYDTAVDIAINFDLQAVEMEKILSHPLLRFYPKPMALIMIDIEPEIGALRKSDGTPAAYLADRKPYYLSIAEILDAPVVDGNKSTEEVSKEIWQIVSSLILGSRRATEE